MKSSNQVAAGVLDFRGRLGIESGHESRAARRWVHAVGEVRDKALASASGGVSAAGRAGADSFDRVAGAFREIDVDGDGIPDKSQAAVAAGNAGAAVKGAATSVSGAIGSMFTRKAEKSSSTEVPVPEVSSDQH